MNTARAKAAKGTISQRSGTGDSPVSAFSRFDFITAFLLSLLSFLIFFPTMCRSVPYIDGGELTTVLWTLGIAHPTGYPLWTLLGYLFVHIPTFSEVASRANLFATVCTSLAVGMFYLAFAKMQEVFGIAKPATGKKSPIKKTEEKKPATERNEDKVSRVASALGALTLAFAQTFWKQATVVETYSLQLVLFASIIIAWLALYNSLTNLKSYIAGLVLGLGFTNHMTTVLTIPALAFLFASAYRQKRISLKSVYFIIIGGLTAALVYLYLPIRASQAPLINWGNPDTLKRFYWQLSAKQFRTWMFSSFDVFEHQLGVFTSSILPEFRVSIIVILAGMIVAFVSYRRWFWFTILLILGDVIYACNYNIHNIHSYFLLAFIGFAVFSTVGYKALEDKIRKITDRRVAALLLIFPIISAVTNFSSANASRDYSVESYTRDMLTSVPKNSVVISFQWDIFVAGSIYYQHVDNVRPDVTVIDKELLRRSWYTAQVHSRYPFLFPKNDEVYDFYQNNLRLFENNLPYDPATIERSYSDFIREIIFGALRDGRKVFVGPEIESQYLYGFNRIPCGLLFELKTDTSYVPFSPDNLNGFQAAQKVDNSYSHQILNFYEMMFLARAGYEYTHRHLDLTIQWLDKALKVNPSSQQAQTAKRQVLQELRFNK